MRASHILRLRMERAVATMDPRSRAVFLLHRLDDLPYDKIGFRLDLTVAEVERHIADAILHIDRVLTALEGQGNV